MAKFKIRDRVYEWDGDFTLAEAMLFFDRAHVGMAEVQREMVRGNPYVTVTLMYILKRRAGEALRWEDLQDCSVADFQPVPDDDQPEDGEAGEVAGELPDPTKDAGTIPEPDTATT